MPYEQPGCSLGSAFSGFDIVSLCLTKARELRVKLHVLSTKPEAETKPSLQHLLEDKTMVQASGMPQTVLSKRVAGMLKKLLTGDQSG